MPSAALPSLTGPTSVLESVLHAARDQGRTALIGYLPSGFPHRTDSLSLLEAMAEGGVDVIELGWPAQNPALDGPVIRMAQETALRGGWRPDDLLRTTAALAERGVPVLCMTYWRELRRYGTERFCARFSAAGGCGLVTPDAPPEDVPGWAGALRAHGLDRVLLAPHGTGTERLALLRSHGSGFAYVTASAGRTGDPRVVHDRVEQLTHRVRAALDLPVCVGVGLSTGPQVARAARYADGVVVGTAFVRRVAEADDTLSAARALRAFARELSEAVRPPRTG
ncbi:tryptophan synthase subunit alpha [Streptomyces roseirectus]|uniref:Tryptophan synthase alpha chain n=1 Tax=Streptomyces roseirectus TaxID=2768066 RepID=A0A7H0I7U4_9ACTN|nr:tryptophan synthase subunit alpha [Streptomyces roseirectus]QNP68860.1 tryptophan synthase subunit alpha [Streptomyces roseirectus]